jgi:UTP-glucose-1-phosphate uridylyltransferase
MAKPTLLVLAAGMGSRYGGLKQLDKLGPSGETIIDYSVYDAIREGFGKIVFVIRENIEEDFKNIVISKFEDKIEVDYVFQELENVPEGVKFTPERQKPWGTGHAVLVARDKINEPFAVINADDFYGREAYKLSSGFLSSVSPGNPDYCMIGYMIKNTLSDYGSVSRGVCEVNKSGYLVDVVERKNIERVDGNIVFYDNVEKTVSLAEDTMVSMNFWGFTTTIFQHLETYFREFINMNSDNPKAEFYIPTAISALINNNQATVKAIQCSEKWFGVTYKEDREQVVDSIQTLVKAGKYPRNLWGI